jgi:hypothetical protein
VKLRILSFTLPALLFFLALPLPAQNFNEEAWGSSSPGVVLQFNEISRVHSASGTEITYTLTGKGFPPNKPYSLWGWIPGHKPQRAIEGIAFDSKGMVICDPKAAACKTEAPGVPLKIKTTAVLGEPKRLAVVSDDGRVAGFAEAVPFPIEASDKGCKLTAVRQTPLAEKVLVSVTGFVPYEMLNVSTHLGGADSVHSPTASAEGSWQAVMATKTASEPSGVAKIKVTGQKCSVSLSFNWGENSAKVQ